MDAAGLLATSPARAQGVEADAGDDRRQPAAKVLDSGNVSAADPKPGFLNGVVGLGERAEHPIGDGTQVRAVLLEALGELGILVRGHVLRPVGVRRVTPPKRRT